MVTLMFGAKRSKRTTGKNPCAPGAAEGGGTKTGSSIGRSRPLRSPQPSQEFPSMSNGGGGG